MLATVFATQKEPSDGDVTSNADTALPVYEFLDFTIQNEAVLTLARMWA